MRLCKHIGVVFRNTFENGGLTMFGRKILWVFALLILVLVLVPSAFATPPTSFDDGYWFVNPDSPPDPANNSLSFCFTTISSGLMEGCGFQQLFTNGRAVKGVYKGLIGDQYVECEYNLASFSLPNGKSQSFSRFSMLGCTDGAGNDVALHMVGQAYDDGDGSFGTYEGRFHFDP